MKLCVLPIGSGIIGGVGRQPNNGDLFFYKWPLTIESSTHLPPTISRSLHIPFITPLKVHL